MAENGGGDDGAAPIVPVNITDPYSVYYLSANDNTTVVVITPPLDGNNYHNWK